MKAISKILFTIIFSLIMFLLLFNMDVYAEEFSLEKESIDLWLNYTSTLWTNGGQGDKVWKSSDESIVTVDNEGKVKGLKIGTATITVTRGSETDSCTVNVVYESLTLHGNSGTVGNIVPVNLLLSKHETEQLKAVAYDGMNSEVSNAVVTWESSDKSIVTVDNSGKIKGLKQGTATITAKAAGVSATTEVKVYSAPQYTDFSKANFQLHILENNKSSLYLKINGVSKPEEDSKFYYIITPDKVKPEIKINEYGNLDLEAMGDSIEKLSYVKENGEFSISQISKYTELNQDMYVWVVEEIRLKDSMYWNSDGEYIQYSNKFVVEGKKIERTDIALLDDIIYYVRVAPDEFDIELFYPLHTKERKFTLKIGEVTDREILQKIKNDDYSGIKELLSYSKNNTPVFTTKLENNKVFSFGFDCKENLIGDNVLKHNAFYYVYVELDTENGKYYPVEAINLYQAYNVNEMFGIKDCNWDSWDDSLDDDGTDNSDTNKPNDTTKPDANKPTDTTKPDANKPTGTTKPDTNKPTDTTTANKDIPHTGLANTIIYVAIILSIVGVVIGIIKHKKYQF